jgi:hypothetical protein
MVSADRPVRCGPVSVRAELMLGGDGRSESRRGEGDLRLIKPSSSFWRTVWDSLVVTLWLLLGLTTVLWDIGNYTVDYPWKGDDSDSEDEKRKKRRRGGGDEGSDDPYVHPLPCFLAPTRTGERDENIQLSVALESTKKTSSEWLFSGIRGWAKLARSISLSGEGAR